MNRTSRLRLLLALCCLSTTAALADEQTWQLALNDADVREVVREVGQILEQTVILDPRVKGKLSVLSAEQLDRDGVRRLFYSALNAQGFAAVNDGERLLVVPANEAKTWANRQIYDLPDAFDTQVFELGSSVAADLAALLRPLVSANGYIGPSSSANALVITDSVANLERLAELIEQLDAGEQHNHSLVSLRHAQAEALVPLVEAAIGRAEAGHKVLADPAGNRILILGPAKVRERLERLVRSFDTPTAPSARNWRVMRLNHADAGHLAKVMGEVGKRLDEPDRPGDSRQAGSESKPKVEADESQNALVLVAQPERLRALEQIVGQLDKPRAQVLIQAAIVEVSGDINEALGVQWGINSGDVLGVINFPGTDLALSDFLAAADGRNGSGAAVALGSDRFVALVSALASNTRNNLLSTPSLLTLDNQEAEILVGQNVPFRTGSYTTSGGGADNPFTTVERKDIGISLKIRPHINEGSNLRLEVQQESSEIIPGLEGEDIITNKRSLKSTILADDGQIIVLGGLIKDSVRSEESAVPLLGRLPWVGGLFRWRSDSQVKTNLMVFLRPTVLRSAEALEQRSREQFEGIRRGSPEGWLDSDPASLFEPSANEPAR